MKKYDLNMRCGSQVVETIIQSGEYKGRIISIIGGNCYGRCVLDFDFGIEEDNVRNDCNLQCDYEEDLWNAILHDKDNNKLCVDGSSEDFNDMIVKNEIIGQFKTNDEAIVFADKILS